MSTRHELRRRKSATNYEEIWDHRSLRIIRVHSALSSFFNIFAVPNRSELPQRAVLGGSFFLLDIYCGKGGTPSYYRVLIMIKKTPLINRVLPRIVPPTQNLEMCPEHNLLLFPACTDSHALE